MNDVDIGWWIKATNLEMESMYFNSVQELIDKPDGVKPINYVSGFARENKMPLKWYRSLRLDLSQRVLPKDG